MSKIEEMLKDLAATMADFEGRLARIEQKRVVTSAPTAVTTISVCPR